MRGGVLFHHIAVLLSRVHAVLRSCLALTLVKYMITWYPIKELPLRFLFWNVAFAGLVSSLGLLPEITFNKISLTVDIGGIIFFTNISLLYYAIQVGFSNLIGGPKDITWLLPHQKLYYSQRAASESFYAKAAGAVWWKHQVRPEIFLFHGIHILMSLIAIDLQRFTVISGLFHRLGDVSDLWGCHPRRPCQRSGCCCHDHSRWSLDLQISTVAL